MNQKLIIKEGFSDFQEFLDFIIAGLPIHLFQYDKIKFENTTSNEITITIPTTDEKHFLQWQNMVLLRKKQQLTELLKEIQEIEQNLNQTEVENKSGGKQW